MKDLLKINASQSLIGCINALKVFSCMWIISGHRADLYFQALPVVFQKKVWSQHNNFFLSIGLFARAVDTFFACSGVVVTQSLLRSYEKYFIFNITVFLCIKVPHFPFRQDFNVVKMFAIRLLRVAPPVGVLVTFFMSSLPSMMARGPSFEHLRDNVNNCKERGWTNMVFIQNYFPLPYVSCSSHFEYLLNHNVYF